jgi:ribonuclease III
LRRAATTDDSPPARALARSTRSAPDVDRERLEERIGYRFSRPDLLARALTHRSHSAAHNERLEFLGDSVLNCVVAAELFERFGALPEGDLSRLRAHLVRQQALHEIAQSLDLGGHLQLGEGELKSGGSARPSILADAFEALVGAVFLDGGFPAAHEALRRLYEPLLAGLDPEALGKDPKTLLQELLQARRIALPQYSVLATRGAAHSQDFEVECVIPQLSVRTTGRGSSRRTAEQEAAMRAFEQIRG